MPPQAAITRPGESPDDGRITAVLAYLDGAEMEGYIQPYVASTVRKKLGLPPRHWPPQAGDLWDDGMPFGGSLWFAQVVHGTKRSHLMMVPAERGNENVGTKSPEELMESAPGFPELTLVYRRKDDGQ